MLCTVAMAVSVDFNIEVVTQSTEMTRSNLPHNQLSLEQWKSRIQLNKARTRDILTVCRQCNQLIASTPFATILGINLSLASILFIVIK